MSIVLSIYWTRISELDIQYKSNYLTSLFTSIIAALGLSLLLPHEEQRSHRVSALATLYLLATILCDTTYLTIFSWSALHSDASLLVFFRCSVHAALLLLGFCSSWSSSFCPLSTLQSPEELYGTLSRAMFIWVNSFLLQGYKRILTHQDLPLLNRAMKPEVTRQAILETWSQRG